MATNTTLHGVAESAWLALAPQLPGLSVEVVAQIDSTNSELMRRARAGQLDPVLLVAERQLAGRGRMGRDWHSEPLVAGAHVLPSLTFSLGLVLPSVDLSGLSLAVGLSVVHSLHPQLRLKWPNDVWLEQRKLAGILIETASFGGQRYVVIGIGVNILPPPHTDLRTAPAALVELQPAATAASALQALVGPLVQMLQTFARQGFAASHAAYHARDALYGALVQCSGNIEGVARGVDVQGALLVHTAQGLQKISSSEVSVRVPPATGLTP